MIVFGPCAYSRIIPNSLLAEKKGITVTK